LAFWRTSELEGGSCGARRKPAARAAFCGLRGVLRRDDDALACGKAPHPMLLHGYRHHEIRCDCVAALPAPRLLSAAHALVTRKPALNAPPLPPLLRSGTTRKPLATRAQRTRFTVRCTDAHRGRPRGRDGQPRRFPSPHPALAARQAQTLVAPRAGGPGGGQPRCARRNPKESPKARTRMRMGKSGANAPDRNRGRPPSGPPARGATYEDRLIIANSS
jgi:hypothetical protein